MRKIRQLPTLPSLLAEPGLPVIHRDISWLQFNERVLDEARPSSGNPLLERVKFLAISASNLDEYFMIRVASMSRTLRTRTRLSKWRGDVDHLSTVWASILETVAKFGAKQQEVLDLLIPELRTHHICLVADAKESPATQAIGREIFEQEILPKLAPPESFEVSKLSALPNLKTAVIFPDNKLWFTLPAGLPNLFALSRDGERYYFFLDDLLENFLGPTFGLQGAVGLVRLTRDADISVDIGEEDPESLPDVMLSRLLSREKGIPMRLQYRGNLSDDLLSRMADGLKLRPEQVLPAQGSLVLQSLWMLVKDMPVDAAEKGLAYPPLYAPLPAFFKERASIFDKLKKQDYLLHHPYDPFDAFVEFVHAAAEDPLVKVVEQTIYRMDDASPLLGALKMAAARGKKVRVIIELRARFDEANNLKLADELRKAGVEVAYGLGALKLHAKATLVTREEPEGVRLYTHLSTGNYNSTTARQYTDLAILTSHAGIGQDARLFFDAAWEGRVPGNFKYLLSAPTGLHRKLLSLIDGEIRAARAGSKTRIVLKVNALVDPQVVEALYEASLAGVKVDLIVRGACSVIPGVKGLSDNIQVVSVVDRFLEHSRLYYFESARALYLSSADCLPRNFFSRLEVAFPVLDESIYRFLEEVAIPTYLKDNVKARELTPQGTWKRRTRRVHLDRARSQFVFEDLARQAYQGTSLVR